MNVRQFGAGELGVREFGDWTVRVLEAGRFALDGGAMFGSVPRGIWQNLIPPDAEHRIPLALRLLLLEHRAGHRVLVDTGVGDKFSAELNERFAVHAAAAGDLRAALDHVGWPPESVTHIILTHLHFDHAGGATRLDAEGTAVPVFPGAVHYLQRENFETAERPNPRERASYLAENLDPLRDVPLELLDGETSPLPGVTVSPSHGHTAGLQVVRVEGGGQVLYFPADLAPTRHHLHIPFTMGYDLSARTIMAEKAAWLERAVAEEALVIFEHDPSTVGGRVLFDGRKYQLGEEFGESLGAAGEAG